MGNGENIAKTEIEIETEMWFSEERKNCIKTMRSVIPFFETSMVAKPTRDNAGGSSRAQIQKHHVCKGEVRQEEWHYQFSVATHGNHAKNGALLEIVKQTDVDDTSTEKSGHWLNKEESEEAAV